MSALPAAPPVPQVGFFKIERDDLTVLTERLGYDRVGFLMNLRAVGTFPGTEYFRIDVAYWAKLGGKSVEWVYAAIRELMKAGALVLHGAVKRLYRLGSVDRGTPRFDHAVGGKPHGARKPPGQARSSESPPVPVPIAPPEMPPETQPCPMCGGTGRVTGYRDFVTGYKTRPVSLVESTERSVLENIRIGSEALEQASTDACYSWEGLNEWVIRQPWAQQNGRTVGFSPEMAAPVLRMLQRRGWTVRQFIAKADGQAVSMSQDRKNPIGFLIWLVKRLCPARRIPPPSGRASV